MRRLSLSAAAVAALSLAPSLAAAHINILSPTPRNITSIKNRHCGPLTSTRTNVYTTMPGTTLHLVWAETIQHPGYFRISFQQNGEIFRIPAVGPTAGAFPTENLTGQTDPDGSGSLIIADQIADGTTTFDVPLPNVECDNCTLQLIQVMTDKPPYTIDTASNDIYFQCVDLVLSNTAPPPIDAGPINPGDPDAGGGGGDSSVSGGCSTSPATSGTTPLALLGLALALTLRRRR